MTGAARSAGRPAAADGVKKALIVLGSLAVTALLLYLVLVLGAWGFDTRRVTYHEGRLRRLVEKQPALEQVVRGLAAEGSPLVAAPADEAALGRAAAEWGGVRREEVVAKGDRFAATRVFHAGDMVYFLYFDAAGVLRDYTCVSR